MRRDATNPTVVAAPVDTTAISVRDAAVSFAGTGGAPAVLEHLSLEVPRGQFLAIAGPSGCGKTTLLNLIAGLIKPAAGGVFVRGAPPAERHGVMSYMPARDALLPWRTALANVTLPLEGGRSNLKAPERRDRAARLLDRLGLSGYEKFFPHQLSQGMRQRVAVARALVSDPEVLLMDEPFGALDAQTKVRVQSEFLGAWEGSGKTVVFVTHDLQEALLLADRVIVMRGRPGRICSDQRVDIPRPRAATLQEIFVTDAFRALYHDLIGVLYEDDRH